MLITNPTHREDFISLEAVVITPEFSKLNPSQRRFVVRYIDQGTVNGTYDAVDAVRHAYGMNTKYVEIRAYQILRNRTVKKVLDIHFRRSGLDSILSDLRRAAKQSVKLKLGLTPATVKALTAFAAFVAAKEKSKGAGEV